jgi:hypothetical protein
VRHRAPDFGEAGGDVWLTFELGRHREAFDRTPAVLSPLNTETRNAA